jgi:hypothetical protein
MPSINSPKRWEPCTTDKATYTGLPLAAHALACVVRADMREDLNSWLKSNDHREWSQETFGSRFAQHSETVRHGVTKARPRHPIVWRRYAKEPRPLGVAHRHRVVRSAARTAQRCIGSRPGRRHSLAW